MNSETYEEFKRRGLSGAAYDEDLTVLLKRGLLVMTRDGHLFTRKAYEMLPEPRPEIFEQPDPPMPRGAQQVRVCDALHALGPLPRDALAESLAESDPNQGAALKTRKQVLQRAITALVQSGVLEAREDGTLRLRSIHERLVGAS